MSHNTTQVYRGCLHREGQFRSCFSAWVARRAVWPSRRACRLAARSPRHPIWSKRQWYDMHVIYTLQFNLTSERLLYLGSPHQPHFEDVHVATTLNGLVASVVGDVVVLVRLEQIGRVHLVATQEQTLLLHIIYYYFVLVLVHIYLYEREVLRAWRERPTTGARHP